jgi:hypothetical protein
MPDASTAEHNGWGCTGRQTLNVWADPVGVVVNICE